MMDKRLVPANFDSLSADQKREVTLVQMWLRSKSKTTQYNYGKIYTSLKEKFPFSPIWQVSTLQLTAFFASMSESTSKRSLATYRATLSSLMDFLVRMRMREDNPVLNTDQFRFTDSLRSKVISKEDILKLVQETTGRNRGIIKFLYFSGVRASEAVAIKWSDIFFEKEKVRIEIIGKGSKQRSIFLKLEVFKDIALDLLPDEENLKLKKNMVSAINRERFLFESKDKSGISRVALYKIISKESLRVLGRELNPHMFRHSNASHALRNGAPINVVQKTLGHSDLNTTAKYLGTTTDESGTDWLEI